MAVAIPGDRSGGVERGRLAVLAALATLTALACAAPVGVEFVHPRDVHRMLTANALSSGEPSAASLQVLHRLDLSEAYRSDAESALAALREEFVRAADPDLAFALAELCFLHGKRAKDRRYFLATAVYAHAFLGRAALDEREIPIDPRFRLAADLYNRGLTIGLASDDGREVLLEPRRLPLPFGELELSVRPEDFLWGGFRLVHFVPVAELKVRGLRNRFRQPGLGAPLAASLAAADVARPPPGQRFIPERTKVAATVLLFLREVERGIADGRLQGVLELYTLDQRGAIEIGGRTLPLEYEITSALAYGLSESSFWQFERRGFFSGDFRSGERIGLMMLHPYHPGRIPVVLVHGTVSSPGRWADMINDLQSDRFIRSHFQFWLFQYNTGNPIAYSAGRLRQSLIEAVAELDPEARDPALRRMVVIGHSQGGLLAKLTVVESGNVFWDRISRVPLQELDLRPETREILKLSLFFEPLRFVERVIFIATPHRGSHLTSRRLVRLAAGLVELPTDLVEAGIDVLAADDDRVLLRSLDQIPSSVDNMTPDNPFLTTLASLPISSRVMAHSIVAVRGDGPVEAGDDGVVDYRSAHLDGVASEQVIRAGHSVQSHPATVREVKRILREHAAAPGG